MEKKRIGSLTAITLRLAALVLGIWLLCMVLLTLALPCTCFRTYRNRGWSWRIRRAK